MLKTYFKIAFRNLFKHKLYAFINVFGLGLGIACSIILFQFITYHLSFDTYHANAGKIYKVGYDLHIPDGSIEYERGAPLILEKAIDADIPQVQKSAVILKDRSFTVAVTSQNGGRKLFSENETIALTDGRFFKLFSYDWKQGAPSTALTQPNTAVITESLAQKYFGSYNVLGKTLIIDNKLPLTITGVLATNRHNTDIKEELFISLGSFHQLYPEFAAQMQTDWNFINSHTALFVELDKGASPKAVEKTITALVNKAINLKESSYDYKLLPLLNMHFDGRRGGVIQKPMLVTLGIVGLLLLVIACVNFVNMATAQSTRRAKEIGTRKVLGSSPFAIFKQFIIETACVALLALVVAIAAIFFFLPIFNNWLGTSVSLNFTNYQLPLFLFGILTFVILAAGFYPGIVLSRFKPVSALKNQINNNISTSRFARMGLIVGQNVIAQVLIICTLLITLQTRYLKNTDPGFDKSAVVILPLPDKAKAKTDYLRNVLMSKPGVKTVSFCYSPAQSLMDKGGSIKYDTRDWEAFTVFTKIGDANYVKTFGLKIIAGRDIAESDSAKQFLLNEKAVQKLGVKNINDVIGRKLVCGDLGDAEGIIVGVVKDFHSRSLYKPIDADLITSSRDYYQFVAVKITGQNLPATVNNLRGAFNSVYPDNVFEYHFLDEQINDMYKKEDLLGNLIKASTAVAILISCLGLLGLIAMITAQRTKEIGIRKVLGASVASITALLSKDFLKLVLVAILISSPIAWLLMKSWLQNFAYHIDIPVWVFTVTALLSLLIAITTTAAQSVKAAIANPVRSLRND